MARAMIGLNENDNGDMGRYLDMSEGIRADLDCTMATVAHSGKDESKSVRGASAALGGFDSIMRFDGDKELKILKVKSEFMKDTEDFGPHCFRLTPVDVTGMTAGRSVVLKPITPEEYAGAGKEAGAGDSLRAEVLEMLYGRSAKTPHEAAELLWKKRYGEKPDPMETTASLKYLAEVKRIQKDLNNQSTPARYKEGRSPLNGLYVIDGIRDGKAHPKLFLYPEDNVVDIKGRQT